MSKNHPEYGHQRFTCECQSHFTEVADALRHTFAGHEIGVEVYRQGSWHWDERTTMAGLMLRRWDGDPQQLIREVEMMGDVMERQATAVN